MFEMMKSLTLFTKDIAKTRDNDRYRNSYIPRPYWNNQRGPVEDNNRQIPRRNEVTETKNVNLCEEPEEDPEVFDPEDQGINLVEDFTDDKNFGKILLEEEDWDEEEDMVCTTTQPTTQIYQRRSEEQDITPLLDKHLILEEEANEHDICYYDLGIDIEQELHKVMKNVSLSELVKLPAVKD